MFITMIEDRHALPQSGNLLGNDRGGHQARDNEYQGEELHNSESKLLNLTTAIGHDCLSLAPPNTHLPSLSHHTSLQGLSRSLLEHRLEQLEREVAQIPHLQQKIAELEIDNQDLQVTLSTAIEHGDLIEEELQNINQQLRSEILERQRTEKSLNLLLDLLAKQKNDLEIMLQILTEHGDLLDMQWQEKLQQITCIAELDSLTQVANRRKFDQYLLNQWQQLSQIQAPMGVLLCDIDFFKQYNDTYGHCLGDDCLRTVARCLQETFQDTLVTFESALPPGNPNLGLVSRYGGEEFAIILPYGDLAMAATVAQNIIGAVRRLQIPHRGSLVSSYVTLSVGVGALVPQVQDHARTLVDEADRYLYLAKRYGRNQGVCAQGTLGLPDCELLVSSANPRFYSSPLELGDPN